jgi:hypothetical protein
VAVHMAISTHLDASSGKMNSSTVGRRQDAILSIFRDVVYDIVYDIDIVHDIVYDIDVYDIDIVYDIVYDIILDDVYL